MKTIAAEMSIATDRLNGVRRDEDASVRGLSDWRRDPLAFSAADPDTLARAVRAHKAGDAFAQAALTLALMLAIGVVAFVLSSGHAAAAGLLVEGVADHAALVSLIALAGGSLLLGLRVAVRAVRVRR